MCILERIAFACTHTVQFARRYHTQPALQPTCHQPLLTIDRTMTFDCPKCRLTNLRGFPYIMVPFGLVVRDDSLLDLRKGEDGRWEARGDGECEDVCEGDEDGEWEIIVAEKGEGDKVLDEIEAEAEEAESEGGGPADTKTRTVETETEVKDSDNGAEGLEGAEMPSGALPK